MEVSLSPEQEAQLHSLANKTGKSADTLALEAIDHLLQYEERYIQAVEKGLASLDRGEFLSHEDVGHRMESWLQS